MSGTKCPACEAQVLPGDPTCRRCGYDFITGQVPEPEAVRQARRIGRIVGFGSLFVGLPLLAFLLLGRGEDPSDLTDQHPCLQALRHIQPLVKARMDSRGALPSCGATPPGPTDCWFDAGVAGPDLPRSQVLVLELRARAGGFSLECRTDLDDDGGWAVFEANAHLTGIRLTDEDVE
jgi:hypothetical protein